MTSRVLWQPGAETIERANITRYARWLEGRVDETPQSYQELWRWSVEEVEDFWESVWRYFDVRSSSTYTTSLEKRVMPGAKWFAGSRLNYARQIFDRREPSKAAIIAKTEESRVTSLDWGELESKTAGFAQSLKELGVGKGDRVAAYLPNVPEAVISMLACASIGAIWSSCAPDFGSQSVIDRFKQVGPKLLIAANEYTYRGRRVSKQGTVSDVMRAIPSIEKTIVVGDAGGPSPGQLPWEDLAKKRGEGKMSFEAVPFDHPLYILYSSGTTGLPKPIVHGHGGILLEHLKALAFHNDLGPGDRMFWYTSTGWMMWNYLVSSLLLGSTIVLYDGDPFYPGPGALWSLAEETGMTFLGASAAYVNALMKSGFEPASSARGLGRLRGFGSTGSALTADAFEWVYRHVKGDIWLTSISGGTDLCTAFVGGCPLLPVRAGEIQCRELGADVAAYDDQGRAVLGEMGELVIRQPMPSMPVFFWGDESGERYRESYFAVFPGVWRHGDWIRVEPDGSCVIYGRSDATIKRMGVRLGTSEVYRVVESLPQVTDSLVVDLEFLGGQSFMQLFLVLKEGVDFDDALREEVRRKIRSELSPRMVPDEIIAVPEVPKTLNGKKLEVPIRRIFLGEEPSKVYQPGALKNPASMDFFIDLASRRRKGTTHTGDGSIAG